MDLTSARLTLEDLQREPTIYQVPDCDSEDQAIGYLGRASATSSKNTWFEFSFHSMVVDLCDDVLEQEEL